MTEKPTLYYIHYQYESKDGNLSGHATGHGFTIVWNDRPPADYTKGAEVKDILDVCQERLDFLDNYKTLAEKKAYALIGQALELLQNEEDENWDGELK